MRWTLIFPLVIAVLGAACTDDGERATPAITSVDGVPIDAEGVLEPGTSLGDGLSVPDGAIGIGMAFPLGVTGTHNGIPVEDRGWEAYLAVTGDPHQVLRAFADQASRKGIELGATRLRPVCETSGSLGDYFCFAAGTRTTADDRYIAIDVTVRRGQRQGRPVSHAWVQYSDTAADLGVTRRVGPLAIPAAAPPAPPRRWPAPAKAGQWSGIDPRYGERVTVQTGSFVAGPLVLNEECSSTTGTAVLRVTGSPRQVATRYAREFATLLGGEGPAAVRERRDGATTTYAVFAGDAGGSSFNLRVIDGPGDAPVWALLETCHD